MESLNTPPSPSPSPSLLLCCMCGDMGILEQLFQCSICRFRVQHRYCSNLYPKLERYSACNWCFNGGAAAENGGTRKRGRTVAEGEDELALARRGRRFTNRGFMEYRNLDECFAYIENLMIEHGPFDGLMGFSQGAILSAALVGLQSRGLALTRAAKLKYLIVIGGAKFQSPAVGKNAYPSPPDCTSLHFLGDMDFLKLPGEALLESFVNPFVIRHPKGHTVPRLDDKSMETMLEFLDKIETDLPSDETRHEEEAHLTLT